MASGFPLFDEFALQRQRLRAYGTMLSRRTCSSTHRTPGSDLIRVEVLDLVLDGRHEFIGDGAIDQAVIEAERQIGHCPDRDRQ